MSKAVCHKLTSSLHPIDGHSREAAAVTPEKAEEEIDLRPKGIKALTPRYLLSWAPVLSSCSSIRVSISSHSTALLLLKTEVSVYL